MGNAKEEQKQLDKISAHIKVKRAEVLEFDKKMEADLAKLDGQRDEIIKLREGLVKETALIAEKNEELERQTKQVNNDLGDIKMKRVALGKLAEASDKRLTMARALEEKNNKTLRDIEGKQTQADDNSKDLEKELKARLKVVDDLKIQKQQEFLKAKDQFEALQRERAEIAESKTERTQLLKEVSESKERLATQLNQAKDSEQRTHQRLIDIKNREQNCQATEKIQKDSQIELDAMWAKVNRKAEIMGFQKELEESKV